MAIAKKNPTQEVSTTSQKSLIEMLQTCDHLTIDQVKDSATGALVQFAIQCIGQGDTKRADCTMKLIDLIHKYATKVDTTVKDDQSYSAFLEGMK